MAVTQCRVSTAFTPLAGDSSTTAGGPGRIRILAAKESVTQHPEGGGTGRERVRSYAPGVVGNSSDRVTPAMAAAPRRSIATAATESSSSPPMKVDPTTVDPVASSFVMYPSGNEASVRWNAFDVTGKSCDPVTPTA